MATPTRRDFIAGLLASVAAAPLIPELFPAAKLLGRSKLATGGVWKMGGEPAVFGQFSTDSVVPHRIAQEMRIATQIDWAAIDAVDDETLRLTSQHIADKIKDLTVICYGGARGGSMTATRKPFLQVALPGDFGAIIAKDIIT